MIANWIMQSEMQYRVLSPDKPRYIEYTAMYWRKANAIHNWFVQNVQSGNDDCGHYDVSKDDLITLRDLCDIVIATAKQIPGQVKIGGNINGR